MFEMPEAIAWRYPAVELLTAVVFVADGVRSWMVGISHRRAGICIRNDRACFIDAEHMILPDVITYPLLVFALVVRVVFPIAFPGFIFSDMTHAPISSLAGNRRGSSASRARAVRRGCRRRIVVACGRALETPSRRRGDGVGDVKMMFGVGALLGWRLTLFTILLARLRVR